MPAAANGHRWKAISRAAGLTIVIIVLGLVCWATITSHPYDTFTISLLLAIAAWLLGVPSIASLVVRRNGSGS